MGDDGFAVTLNFGDAPEPLYIPYDAIRTFVDPSVEFGLRFEQQEPVDADETEDEDSADLAPSNNDAGAEIISVEPKDAEVVSLDSFRK